MAEISHTVVTEYSIHLHQAVWWQRCCPSIIIFWYKVRIVCEHVMLSNVSTLVNPAVGYWWGRVSLAVGWCRRQAVGRRGLADLSVGWCDPVNLSVGWWGLVNLSIGLWSVANLAVVDLRGLWVVRLWCLARRAVSVSWNKGMISWTGSWNINEFTTCTGNAKQL
jgi:hypothetical protein